MVNEDPEADIPVRRRGKNESSTKAEENRNPGKAMLDGLWTVLKWILIILFFPLSLIFVAYFRQKRKY